MEDGVSSWGSAIPGSDPIGNVPTPEACCDLCKQNPLCKLFDWNKNNQGCWLKHTEGQRKLRDFTITGKPGK